MLVALSPHAAGARKFCAQFDATAQFAALAADFFGSFTGAARDHVVVRVPCPPTAKLTTSKASKGKCALKKEVVFGGVVDKTQPAALEWKLKWPAKAMQHTLTATIVPS